MRREPCTLCWDFELFLVPFPLWPPATRSAFLWSNNHSNRGEVTPLNDGYNKKKIYSFLFQSRDVGASQHPNIFMKAVKFWAILQLSFEEIQEAQTSQQRPRLEPLPEVFQWLNATIFRFNSCLKRSRHGAWAQEYETSSKLPFLDLTQNTRGTNFLKLEQKFILKTQKRRWRSQPEIKSFRSSFSFDPAVQQNC